MSDRKKLRNGAGDAISVSAGGDISGSVVGKNIHMSSTHYKTSPESQFDVLSESAQQALQQAQANYTEARHQAQSWTRWGQVAAVVGFALVAGAAILMLSGFVPQSIYTALAGSVAEVGSALFFNQASGANKRLDRNQEQLVQANTRHEAIALCESLPEGEAKSELKSVIAKKIMKIE